MIREVKKITNPAIISELKEFPNQGILWEIIEGNKTGKIFELANNAVLILENGRDPFAFIAGNLTKESARVVISSVREREFPMVYCHPKYHPLFLQEGWNFHLRAELKLKKLHPIDIQDQTLTIKPIKTLPLFQKCFWYKDRSDLYGSDDNVLQYGIGYALCLEDRVVSEAYVSIGGGYAEIGIVVHPDYRGKRYASLVASHLIQKCEETKIIPMWSCNVDNRASLITALKLGFELSAYYTQLVPDCGNVLCPELANWLKINPYP